jgi:hypothetical protein
MLLEQPAAPIRIGAAGPDKLPAGLSAPGSAAAATGTISTEAAATALLARTGFIHIQLPAIELSAIQDRKSVV